MKYYRGDYRLDGKSSRGWLVGWFKKGLRRTKSTEIKFWKFKKGEKTGHLDKRQTSAIECTFILAGKIRGRIEGRRVTLGAGTYVVMPPGVMSNFPIEVLEDAEGITVKAPSLQDDTLKFSQKYIE